MFPETDQLNTTSLLLNGTRLDLRDEKRGDRRHRKLFFRYLALPMVQEIIN